MAGGFSVGKTTFIGSLSDIEPLRTEAAMTEHSVGVDDAGLVTDRKTSTTVAMDFGRISLPGNLWLYLFGTPGQDRFLFMWDDLVKGAIGAVVLVDTDRLDQCFPAVDYFEARQIPFVVAVNCFDGVARHQARGRPRGARRPRARADALHGRTHPGGDQAGAHQRRAGSPCSASPAPEPAPDTAEPPPLGHRTTVRCRGSGARRRLGVSPGSWPRS
nr:ATP/GTP-binding protein [Angustibacter aerolatus]